MDVAATPPRPPLWRNVRVLKAAGQVAFVVIVVLVGREVLLNLQFNVAQQRQSLSFGFLDSRAGFPIGEGIEYSANDRISRAFLVGLFNTFRVAAIGIVLSSVLGLLIGVGRLSSNWLIRKITQVYVDVIRNTPVLLQIVFWWTAVFLVIPTIQNSLSLFDAIFLSNRGTWIPWFHIEPGAAAWGVVLAAGLLIAPAVWRWRTRRNERSGEPHHRVLWASGAFLVVAVGGYVATGTPLAGNIPEFVGRDFVGGIRFSPEYMALLAGLVIYTSAFIGEIVRGSIQAVSKGQKEAAEALGFSRFQQLRFVILPQALRIAIPAVNSQYLNLTKNSTLGLVVGFPELLHVGNSVINQRGHETQVLLILMGTFLLISLAISFVMNLLNRAVTRRGGAG